MSQVVNVNFRLDEEIKIGMEKACQDMGLSMSAAFTIFAKTVARERKIPFEVSADPFYSKSNIEYLENKMSDYKNGNLNFVVHDLVKD